MEEQGLQVERAKVPAVKAKTYLPVHGGIFPVPHAVAEARRANVLEWERMCQENRELEAERIREEQREEQLRMREEQRRLREDQ